MTENGPRTTALEERMRIAAANLEHRITELETKMRLIIGIGGLLGTVLATLIAALILGFLNTG